MKIALFGATGNLGLLLQDDLVKNGHQVRALVHVKADYANHKATAKKPNISYILGDALIAKDIAKTIKGCEAVINVLGGDEKGTIRSQSSALIVQAMQDEHIKRIIAMGGSGILAVGPWRFEQIPVFPKDKRFVSKDHERVHQILLHTSLDWTQLCPSFMTVGPAIGSCKIRVGHPFMLWRQSIRLKDVSNFIVKELKEKRYLGKQLALIN